MRDVVVSYNDPMEQSIWEGFTLFFTNIKGYDDWTDEQIALSMNEDDIDEYCKYIKEHLVYDRKRI